MSLQEGHGMVTVENEAEQLNWSVHETATHAYLNQLWICVRLFSVERDVQCALTGVIRAFPLQVYTKQ